MKKNLLKLLTLVLALVMVVTVFAGCKKADEETVAPTQGSEETPTETQEQPADEYKPSAAQLLNGKEWGKDYTELYDEIGDKVTIDDVQEDPTTGLAYVEYEGKTYELGMDFLSMAMVYKTAVPENSQYETEDDVYAAWWKYYMTRWNYLLPEIPLYSNEYYDVYNAKIKGVDEHPTNPYWGPAKAASLITVRSRRLEATPPEHSTGRPGQRRWASWVARRTTLHTVSRVKRATLAGASPSASSLFT